MSVYFRFASKPRVVSSAISHRWTISTGSKYQSVSQWGHSAACFSTIPPPPPPSSGGSSSLNPFSGMWEGYQERSTKKSFKGQLDDIASAEKWNVGAYHDQLGKTANSWKSSVPGLRGQSEVKQAKESYKIMEGIIEAVGRQANMESLHMMTKVMKAKAANYADVTIDKINEEIKLFEMTDQTHRLIMYLKENDQQIPDTPEKLRHLMEFYGQKLLTNREKERMQKIMMRQMKKGMR